MYKFWPMVNDCHDNWNKWSPFPRVFLPPRATRGGTPAACRQMARTARPTSPFRPHWLRRPRAWLECNFYLCFCALIWVFEPQPPTGNRDWAGGVWWGGGGWGGMLPNRKIQITQGTQNTSSQREGRRNYALRSCVMYYVISTVVQAVF